MRELCPRAKAELHVDPTKVSFDRLRTLEESSGHLAIRASACNEQRDLEFLCCELLEPTRLHPAYRFPRRAKFNARLLGPRFCPQELEGDERRTEMVTSVRLSPGPSQTLAVAQLGSRPIEGARLKFVVCERLFERILKRIPRPRGARDSEPTRRAPTS